MTAATELFKIYLSLDSLDLILKAGDHTVQLSNLRLGCAQIITILSSRCLHLLKLLLKRKIVWPNPASWCIGHRMALWSDSHAPSLCTMSQLRPCCG